MSDFRVGDPDFTQMACVANTLRNESLLPSITDDFLVEYLFAT